MPDQYRLATPIVLAIVHGTSEDQPTPGTLDPSLFEMINPICTACALAGLPPERARHPRVQTRIRSTDECLSRMAGGGTLSLGEVAVAQVDISGPGGRWSGAAPGWNWRDSHLDAS